MVSCFLCTEIRKRWRTGERKQNNFSRRKIWRRGSREKSVGKFFHTLT